MMKRLYKTIISEKYVPIVNDIVIFKNHPYDRESYVVKGILPDGSVFIENESGSYSGINPKSLTLLKRG